MKERFLQWHMLTSFPPANLNADDTGKPKTAVMGGSSRLRISSQCLKRNWRTSDVFREALGGLGVRTRTIGPRVVDGLADADLSEKDRLKAARDIAAVFGKVGPKSAKYKHAQMIQLTRTELDAIDKLVETLAKEGRLPESAELDLLDAEHHSADVALFGRMVAEDPSFSVEAAAHVSHAITVHSARVETDFFSAVDDLNKQSESGFLGEKGFGAGVFYEYVCVNRRQLVENMNGRVGDAKKALEALVEVMATVTPSGGHARFGSHARADWILAERTNEHPRSLAVAFLEPVSHGHYVKEAASRLRETRGAQAKVYGGAQGAEYVLDALEGVGTLSELKTFASGGLE